MALEYYSRHYHTLRMPCNLGCSSRSQANSPSSAVKPSWKSEEPNSSSYLQTLIDPAIHLPCVMQAFDKIQAEMQSDPSDDEDNFTLLDSLIKIVLRVGNAISEWDAKLRGGDGRLQIYKEWLPVKTLDDATPVAYSIQFSFISFEVAAAFIFCEMTKIFLYQLIIDMTTCARGSTTDDYKSFSDIDIRKYKTKAMKSADKLCQSTDYFFVQHQRMVGRMIMFFPLETAQTLLCNLSKTGTGDPAQDALLELKVGFCESVQTSLRTEGLASMGGVNLSSNLKR